MDRLKSKFAIVTGAGSGIGRAIALAFAAEGATVSCCDIRIGEAKETSRMIEAAGGKAIAQKCDVADEADVRAVVDAATVDLGRLDILVNNAAYFPEKALITEIPMDQWLRAMQVNITGVFLMSRYAVPLMSRSGGGSIIHIASQMGRVADQREAAYCTTKGAVLSLARAMALDHAVDKIRVNSLSPGGTATPSMAVEFGSYEDAERQWGAARHPLGRLGRPEEIAAAAVFLASDESSFMTGSDLLVDGGYSAQ